MRAVEFNLKDPAFGAELVEVDEPELPNGEWARVAVTVGGICGSDLHLFGNRPMNAPSAASGRSRSCSATRSPVASSKPALTATYPSARASRSIRQSPVRRAVSTRCAASARPVTRRAA